MFNMRQLTNRPAASSLHGTGSPGSLRKWKRGERHLLERRLRGLGGAGQIDIRAVCLARTLDKNTNETSAGQMRTCQTRRFQVRYLSTVTIS